MIALYICEKLLMDNITLAAYNKSIKGRQTSRKPDRDEPSAGAVKHEPQDKIKEVKRI